MTHFKYALILSSALILAACEPASKKPSALETGHDHAAMQSGQSRQSRKDMPAEEVSSYTCPMHPHYIATDPDGSCPICGMDLVPVMSETKGSSGVSVSPEMLQTMGIRTAVVSVSDLGQALRAYGTVEPNTRLESMAASRLEGWIDGLTVRAEGDSVRRGQRLYNIYTPELIAAQKDYLASLQIGNERRIASVRQRLISKGMQESLVERLTETRELIERVPVYAESSGVVTQLMVRDGDYLKPGDPILQLQAYDKVWVIASVPESDLPKMEIGKTATLKFESAPDAPSLGKIDYIYPTIDTKTRTARVRISVDNASGSLRPGAYADIIFEADKSETPTSQLSVPSQAILRDSRGAHVIVALGEGRFAPRDITIGSSVRGRTEVLSGLAEGERIVASGQFMLDSESNLREGFSKLSAPPSNFDETTPLSELPIDGSTLSQIDHMIDSALYFHEALIDGYAIDPYFLDPTLTLIENLKSRFAGSKLSPILENAETAISGAKDNKMGEPLATQLSDLMTALDPWLTLGAPAHYKSKGLIFYSDDETARLWLQEGGLAANPYSDATAQVIAWPDPMAGDMPESPNGKTP
jgi:Cu(I)/Ag(I) efflux system membrane fusion protein